jgi:hypothetical protein
MFVLHFHIAVGCYDALSATRMGQKFLFSSGRARNNFFEEHAKKQQKIFDACGVFSDDEIGDFVAYNVALKRYFDGHGCDIEYLKL